MIFTKKNYLMMLCGIVLLVLGFVLLSGGGSSDPVNEFSYEMFSFRRLWIAPILLLAGLTLEGVAIMYRDKKSER
ncbi:MAG: DUF3098 domain-containing protein [Mucinivorans sp.]